MSLSEDTLQRAKEIGNPVIRGDRATFIWEGGTAPYLISDLHGWEANPKPLKRITSTLEPATGKTVWYCSLTLPRDAYLEYAFYDPATQKRFPDPLNRKSVNNGVGSRNNFFYMPETMPSPFSTRRADVPTGVLTPHRVDTWMLQEYGEREVWLYKPPVKESVPLLVVYDGYDYLHRGRLTTIVDNLIAEGKTKPFIIVMANSYVPGAGGPGRGPNAAAAPAGPNPPPARGPPAAAAAAAAARSSSAGSSPACGTRH